MDDIEQKILESLNEQQKEAVLSLDGAYLVLAGPGSGKTRVITHRFAYLLLKKDVQANNILAVTFTNKAANEMKERIERLTGVPVSAFWVRTFHSLGYRILREYAHLLGYEKHWEAIDEDDSLKVVRTVTKQLDEHNHTKIYSEFLKLSKAENLLSKIASCKEELISPEDVPMAYKLKSTFRTPEQREMFATIYNAYQNTLKASHLMDYSDLLVNTYALFENFSEVLRKYQEQWLYIMVDEFQDTNLLQYKIIKQLAGLKKNIMIVGDDDQSIYGWRGARVENMKRFEEDFQPQVIKLEQNYRSTKTIIRAANALAEYIDDRMGKTLWTENDEGESIKLVHAPSEEIINEWLVTKIKDVQSKGYALRDMAVFYRINAQSESIEETLVRHEIPYHIVGSLRFFERREVKDVLAYIAFLVNPRNVVAFERMIHTPPRGIGEATLEKLIRYTQEKRCDLLVAMNEASLIADLTASQKHTLQELGGILEELRADYENLFPSTVLRILVENIPFQQYWIAQKEEERWDNIVALVDAARSFEEANPGSTIADFLNYAILSVSEEKVNQADYITLMTIHNAKGLEFPIVFVMGVVEGLIPLARSGETKQGENEETRLFYVAITRAKRELYLCIPSSRFVFGETKDMTGSRFLRYLPEDCLAEEKLSPWLVGSKGEKRRDFSSRLSGSWRHGVSSYFEEESGEQFVEKKFSYEKRSTLRPVRIEELHAGVRIRHRLLGKGEVVTVIGGRVMVKFDNGAVNLLDGNFLSSVELL